MESIECKLCKRKKNLFFNENLKVYICKKCKNRFVKMFNKFERDPEQKITDQHELDLFKEVIDLKKARLL